MLLKKLTVSRAATFTVLFLLAWAAPSIHAQDSIATPAISRVVPTAFNAQERAKWEAIASGTHSLRKLGKEFYVDIPVRPIAGAKLAYFNHELARRLGLRTPEDPADLEKLMTSLFALEKDPTGKSTLKMMATRYQDSSDKRPGSALGDGRAVWTGELSIPLPDGKIAWIDLTAKGIGATPLAWTKNDAAHSDGRQKVRELVRSAIISRANTKNELDSTDDLMGFIVKEEGQAPRTVTIRAGNQTRIAHFRYFSNESANFKKIFQYIVRRDSGLPLEARIGAAETKTYLEMFTDNLAEETARYSDLDTIHGSPTAGNRTTKGSTIDLMEFWYHDAFHGHFRYLFDRLQARNQVATISSYIPQILLFMEEAEYPFPLGVSDAILKKRFRTRYQERATTAWLNRLGLSLAEIETVPPKLREDFFDAVRTLRESIGTEQKPIFWNHIPPAAFDMRSVFVRTFALWSDPARETKIFANERPWATPLSQSHRNDAKKYLSSVAAIVRHFRDRQGPKAEWIEKAKIVGSTVRMIPGTGAPATPGDPFFHAHDEKILRELESATFDYQKVNALIDEAAKDLVDPGLLPRGVTNLGLSPGFPRLPVGNFSELCRALFVTKMVKEPIRLSY
jgi:uncharacterized protein YdiU (UPF0061 family)